jgi:hypothetical protein
LQSGQEEYALANAQILLFHPLSAWRLVHLLVSPALQHQVLLHRPLKLPARRQAVCSMVEMLRSCQSAAQTTVSSAVLASYTAILLNWRRHPSLFVVVSKPAEWLSG